MKQFISKTWKSASVRNVGKLLSANIFAQAVGLLVYPVLTRLYTPEDFGLLNLFTSIAGVLILLSTFEWYNAIVLPKKEEEACSLVHLCLFSIGILTLILIASFPFAPHIANLFNSPQLAHYYWLLPIYVLLMGLWNVLNYWYIRNKQYGRISGYQISQSLFSAGYKAGFHFLPFQGGLIYATILSPLCSLLLSFILAGKKCLAPLREINTNLCKKVAAVYSNFPKYSTPRSLINYVSGNLPILMLAPTFGLTETGFIGMSLTLAVSPVQIVVRSIFQVLYERITYRINARQKVFRLLVRFSCVVSLIIVPAFAGLYFVLPWLTTMLLGQEWEVTGEYIRILLPWIGMIIVATSINFIPDIFGKQRGMLWIEIVYIVLRIGSLAIGIYMDSLLVALSLFSCSGFVVLLGETLWFLILVYRYDQQLGYEGDTE